MEPMQLARHTQAAFVRVDRRSLGDCLDNGLSTGARTSLARALIVASVPRSGTAEEILAELALRSKGRICWLKG